MMRRVPLLVLMATTLLHGATGVAEPMRFAARVTLDPGMAGSVSGRLIVLMTTGEGKTQLEFGVMDTSTWAAGREVSGLTPGRAVEVDLRSFTFPSDWSTAPVATYQVQAFLDVDHSFGYAGPGEGDVTAPPVTLAGFDPSRGVTIELVLDRVVPAPPAEPLPASVEPVRVPTAAVTRFLGQPTEIGGWVILPPGYDPKAKATYPMAFVMDGFGHTLTSLRGVAVMFERLVSASEMPPMIWVLLDHSGPTGTHEFADSVNNGPWGTALTTEVIPYLERHYRTDGKASGRLLTGHSSGGWAALWLQAAYPTTFGGTWPTSPDPADFTTFMGPNIYAPEANAFVQPDGAPRPLIRAEGREIRSVQQVSQLEQVMGQTGGQFASFEWVFSPRGRDGRPLPLFDRHTGRVDTHVAEYWKANYDIAEKITREWSAHGRHLRGKIHVAVGTADTFHFDDSVRALERRLKALGADATFTYLPGKTHFDLFAEGDDRMAFFKKIAAQMYASARPRGAR